MLIIQHANQAIGQFAHIIGSGGFIGPRSLAHGRDRDATEIGLVAGAKFGLWHMQLERRKIGLFRCGHLVRSSLLCVGLLPSAAIAILLRLIIMLPLAQDVAGGIPSRSNSDGRADMFLRRIVRH